MITLNNPWHTLFYVPFQFVHLVTPYVNNNQSNSKVHSIDPWNKSSTNWEKQTLVKIIMIRLSTQLRLFDGTDIINDFSIHFQLWWSLWWWFYCLQYDPSDSRSSTGLYWFWLLQVVLQLLLLQRFEKHLLSLSKPTASMSTIAFTIASIGGTVVSTATIRDKSSLIIQLYYCDVLMRIQ